MHVWCRLCSRGAVRTCRVGEKGVAGLKAAFETNNVCVEWPLLEEAHPDLQVRGEEGRGFHVLRRRS